MFEALDGAAFGFAFSLDQDDCSAGDIGD